MRREIGIEVLCLLAACAGPGRGAPAPAAELAALPAELAGLRRTGEVIDFERDPRTAGLGASVGYVPVSGERPRATVYLYDRGGRQGPEGGDGAAVVREIESTRAELAALVRLGRYRSAQFDTGMAVAGGDGMRCANFRVVQADGAATGDGVCVAVHRGAFLKVRVTSWTTPQPVMAGITAGAVLSEVQRAREAAPARRAGTDPGTVAMAMAARPW